MCIAWIKMSLASEGSLSIEDQNFFIDAPHFFLNTVAGFNDTSDAFIAQTKGENVAEKKK